MLRAAVHPFRERSGALARRSKSSLAAAYVQSARAKLLEKAQSVAVEMREQGAWRQFPLFPQPASN